MNNPTKLPALATLTAPELEFLALIARGEDLADAAAKTGLTVHQATAYTRNPAFADRIRDEALARLTVEVLPKCVAAAIILSDVKPDDEGKVLAAKGRFVTSMLALLARSGAANPAQTSNNNKNLDDMSIGELERRIASLRVIEQQQGDKPES